MAVEALRERGERSEAVATVSGVGRAGGRTSGQGFLPAISAPAVGQDRNQTGGTLARTMALKVASRCVREFV
jgi:hypothetical protein